MTYFHAFILALIQGITEFLPISSEAHLVLAPVLFGWQDQGLAFDVAANTGTLAAVIIFFRRELRELIVAGIGSVAGRSGRRSLSSSARLFWLIGLATLPVAIAGVTFRDVIANQLRSVEVVAWASIVFGLLLYWADRRGRRNRRVVGDAADRSIDEGGINPGEGLGAGLRLSDALIIGLAQALALIPGTSRSGVTITAALFLGLTRPDAARFSFLLAIPTGLMAAGYEGWKLLASPSISIPLGPLALTFLVSLVSAYLVIGWLLDWLRRQSMTLFVVYRVLLGVTILAVLALLPVA